MADDDLLTPPLRSITVSGDGLHLRGWRPEDAACVFDASTDPRIVEMTTVPAHPDGASVAAFIDRQHDRLTTGLGWALAVEHDGEAVGHIGLWLDAKRHGRGEIGYWVRPAARGSAIAARAVQLLATWAFDTTPLHRIDLFIEPWNEASQRTAERSGFRRGPLLRQWQVIDGTPKDMWAFTRLRADADDQSSS